MKIFLLTISIYLEWSNSLKDKRSVLQSLKTKIHNKFNVSIAETDTQDSRRTITLSIVGISNNSALTNQVEDSIISFVENNTDGIIQDIHKEIIY